ncbi:MAG: phage holin family protein [Bacillaceae bacterium]|nr:phage holin family protein [Bacillaceae bacterium]
MDMVLIALANWDLEAGGNFHLLLKVLVIVVFLDYVTGVMTAFIKKEISSTLGWQGIAKKVIIFVFVTIAFFIDTIFETVMLRNLTVGFYIVNECFSIIENAKKLGVPVPPFLISFLDKWTKSKDK